MRRRWKLIFVMKTFFVLFFSQPVDGVRRKQLLKFETTTMTSRTFIRCVCVAVCTGILPLVAAASSNPLISGSFKSSILLLQLCATMTWYTRSIYSLTNPVVICKMPGERNQHKSLHSVVKWCVSKIILLDCAKTVYIYLQYWPVRFFCK